MSAQRLTEKNTDEQDRTASRSAQDGPVRDTGREVVMKTTADARRRASTAGPTHVPDKELLAERVPRRRAANPATWMCRSSSGSSGRSTPASNGHQSFSTPSCR
jgi:hypothetical protein